MREDEDTLQHRRLLEAATDEEAWLALNPRGWDHPMFEQYRLADKEHEDFHRTPIVVDEGVIACQKCASKRVLFHSVQTRSSDEPMTTVCHCTACSHDWRQNC